MLSRISNKQLLRFYSTKKPVSENENEGYMRRKLQQLAEDAFPSTVDPKAGVPEDSLSYNKIEMHSKLEQIVSEPSNFEYQHQQAIGISKLPKSASKETREIAMAKPWRGEESYYDTSLRMLNDSIKPIKIKNSKKTILTPLQPIKSRIHNAKEGALDYQLAKLSPKKEKSEDDQWTEMYKERLLGPSMLLNNSFASVDNSIKSLADQKIMDAQRRGEFKNLKRGKPLDKGYGAMENMFIDRTEYHLNQILKKQDALPPWIEKQGGCDLRISRFRHELDKEWIQWAVNHLKDEFPGLNDDQLIKKMEIYANNETSNDKENDKLRSQKWLDTRKAFFETKVRDLNDVIRGYNLQAPLASQKLYLILDKELNACYKRVSPLLVEAFKRHIKGNLEKDIKPISMHSYNEIPQRENIYQQKSESLISMFKKMIF
jgi:hypothetical protein